MVIHQCNKNWEFRKRVLLEWITGEPEVMESVLRREVERAMSAEWSKEGNLLENRRIPTGKLKLGNSFSLIEELEDFNTELIAVLVEHRIRGFLLLSTIFFTCFFFKEKEEEER